MHGRLNNGHVSVVHVVFYRGEYKKYCTALTVLMTAVKES